MKTTQKKKTKRATLWITKDEADRLRHGESISFSTATAQFFTIRFPENKRKKKG